jgi:hypothetical protein
LKILKIKNIDLNLKNAMKKDVINKCGWHMLYEFFPSSKPNNDTRKFLIKMDDSKNV